MTAGVYLMKGYAMTIFPKWQFLDKRPKETERNPVQGEFFNTESLRRIMDALIREAFQNSLDASLFRNVEMSKREPVKIRIFVSGDERAKSPEEAAEFFNGLVEHYRASIQDVPSANDGIFAQPCRYIVIEDFNTCGLSGDELASSSPKNGEEPNNFYYFFRAEGASAKSSGDKGRWGIGKYVFPKASGINSFFAVTKRLGDDRELLLGKSILKVHEIPGAGEFHPDGWFAIDGDVFEPVVDGQVVSEMKLAWNIARNGETGLSVVVPYIENVDAVEVCQSIVAEYMQPILEGQLEISIDSPSQLVHINKGTFIPLLDVLFGDSLEGQRLKFDARMMVRDMGSSSSEVFRVNLVSSAQWSRDVIAPEQGQQIRRKFDENGFVRVEIPVEIAASRTSTKMQSLLFVTFMKADFTSKPMFLREGIHVSDVRSKAVPQIRSIVRIPGGVLGDLLGDSEGPAHVDWDSKRDSFKGKYLYGKAWIDFVKRSPKSILDLVRGDDEDGDKSVAADWFPDEADESVVVPPVIKPDGGDDGGVVIPPIRPVPPATPKPFRISRVSSGFTVSAAPSAAEFDQCEISCAYDVARGDAMNKWSPLDFESGDLNIEVDGGSAVELDGNRWTFAISDPGAFAVRVIGFDTRRDLIVDAVGRNK